MSVNVETITPTDLRSEKYISVFPEYYQLKGVIENDEKWHVNQNVFDHVLAGFENLEKILSLDFLPVDVAEKISAYLDQRVEELTRKNLLKIGIFLHDIAKKDTVMEIKPGFFSCPGHELIGASQVKNYQERFGLTSTETEYVRRLVLNHGLVSSIATLTMANGDQNRYFELFQKAVGDVAIELLLLIKADDEATDLAKTSPNEFNNREQTLINLLVQASSGI